MLDFLILRQFKQERHTRSMKQGPLNRYCCPCGKSTEHTPKGDGSAKCESCGAERSVHGVHIAPYNPRIRGW